MGDPDVHPRLVAALREQLRAREAELRRGAGHVGWKLGMGCRESIGDQIAVGYLTSTTVVGADCRYHAAGEAELHVDAELCVQLRADLDGGADADAVRVAIGGCLPALEFVDLVARPDEPDSVIAENIFHRAVAFGRTPLPLASAAEVTVYVNDAPIGRSPWPDDIPQRIEAGAELLATVGQRLRAGDQIITGAIVQVPVAPGDRVKVDFGGSGRIAVEVVG